MRRLRRRDEQGAAAVEFALVMPILFLVVFGIIAYGIVFSQTLSLSNSARQAARSGVVEGATCTQVTALAQDAADAIAMDGTDAAVSISRGPSEVAAGPACGGGGTVQPCAGQPGGTNVYVRLVFDTPEIVPFIPVPDQLTGKGVFRCEFS